MSRGIRSEGLIFALQVLRATIGRWRSLREIAGELNMTDTETGWCHRKNAKRIRRALFAIEAAGIPLQIDTVNEYHGAPAYYKISRDWRV